VNRACQQEEERLIFETFLGLEPNFAAEPVANWRLAPSDPPDILCTTGSGRLVGVELSEWLHESEMRGAQERKRFARQISRMIGEPQPANTSPHFDMVILHPKPEVRTSREPLGAFRNALFKLIHDVDRRWLMNPSWQGPQGCRIRELSSYHPLGQYLLEVHFHPGQTQHPAGIEWILPALQLDWFNERTLVEPLLSLIEGKLTKYCKRPIATPCDDLVLLIFFNQGALFNSPLQTPRRPIQVIVEELRAKRPRKNYFTTEGRMV
jgi:hypothetical protein